MSIYFIGLQNIYIYFKQYCCDESRKLEPSTCIIINKQFKQLFYNNLRYFFLKNN